VVGAGYVFARFWFFVGFWCNLVFSGNFGVFCVYFGVFGISLVFGVGIIQFSGFLVLY